MKVGIMSMQRVINYGSYMQALSLKTMLEGLGHEVVFVDYKARPSIQHRHSVKYWLRKGRQAIKQSGLCWAVSNMYRGRPFGYRVRKTYTAGEQAFLPALRELGVDYEHFHYRTKVDALVIGSDEVFNCLQNADNVGFSPELFGKHNRAKTLVSYAASFGNTTLERLNEYGVAKRIGRYLKKFDHISVRDENSAQIVRTLTGREPVQHLDPVLIGGIENREWTGNREQNYIAVYAYTNRLSKEECAEIAAFAERQGLRALLIDGSQKNGAFEMVKDCAPSEIIPYVKNAEMVISDTFHGTIFAIIKHIPFAVYCRQPHGTAFTNSEKLLDLLKKLGLMDRLVSEDNDLDTIFARQIDFDTVDAIRARERTAAIEYLKDALEGQ